MVYAIDDSERATLLHYLTAPDEAACLHLVRDLHRGGATAERLLTDLIAPVQAQVGDLWRANRLTVGEEHAATYITERLIAAAVECAGPIRSRRAHIVVACASGEWHSLPARLVGDVLRLHGWTVEFLGANVPTAQLAAYAADRRPVAALFSATLTSRLPQLSQSVQSCRDLRIPTLVGGAACGERGDLGRRIGADAWAPDAATTVTALLDWPPAPAESTVQERAAEEYAQLTRDHWRLIDHMMRRLAQHYPPLRQYSAVRFESVTAQLEYLLDFLASAVFLDEDAVLVDFTRWLGPTLLAHGESVQLVQIALAAIDEVVAGLPRSRRILNAGMAAFRESATAPAYPGPRAQQLNVPYRPGD